MKTPLTFLLALTFLFLFVSSCSDNFQDAIDAFNKKKYKEAVRLWSPLAEQGDAIAQYKLGMMYSKGQVQHDYDEAIKWFRLAAEQGDVAAKSQLDLLLKEKEKS